MTVETLIKHLEKQGKNQEVRLHDVHGEPVIFVLSAKNKDGVWLETETDTDMAYEIQKMFDDAVDDDKDELAMYTEMLEWELIWIWFDLTTCF